MSMTALEQSVFPFQLPALPYASSALEPHMSAKTFEFHHGKHHKAYVDQLNQLVEGTAHASLSLKALIEMSANQPDHARIFNNAAQVWNHSFFWSSMKVGGGGLPSPAMQVSIEKDFGGMDAFRVAFKTAATTQFGSGWAWLVDDGGVLKVVKTANADLPWVHGQTPLLCVDVWEHAYYLDYQNRRADFVDVFLTHLVNWSFAEANRSLA